MCLTRFKIVLRIIALAGILLAVGVTPAADDAAPDAAVPDAAVPDDAVASDAAPREGRFRKAVLIRFEGEIHPFSEQFLYRKLEEAQALGADLVIVEFDSPGGHLESSLNMAERLRFLDWAHTVAFVPEEAYSGAAIAALGCDEIVMAPAAQFGDAGPIFQGKDSQFRHAPEKIRSVLVSEVRDLAEARGRPPALAQAMVDMELTVYRFTHKTTGEVRFLSQEEVDADDARDQWTKGPPVLETQGKLFLTINGKRAVELKMAEANAANRGELQRHLGLDQPPTVLESGVVDTAVFILNLPLVTVLLFIVGLIALYFELSAPGISVGGLLAGLCFVIFFWSRFLGGTSGWLEILLFLAGVIFLAVELFVIPGFGVSGIVGVLLMLVSLLMASQDFVVPSTPRQLTTLTNSMLVLVGTGVGFIVAVWVLSKYHKSIPVLSRLVLAPPGAQSAMAVDGKDGQAAPVPVASQHHAVQVGDWGIAASPLRPAGKALFEEEYLDVVADGVFVDKDRQVRIVKISGNRIVVREIEDPPMT